MVVDRLYINARVLCHRSKFRALQIKQAYHFLPRVASDTKAMTPGTNNGARKYLVLIYNQSDLPSHTPQTPAPNISFLPPQHSPPTPTTNPPAPLSTTKTSTRKLGTSHSSSASTSTLSVVASSSSNPSASSTSSTSLALSASPSPPSTSSSTLPSASL